MMSNTDVEAFNNLLAAFHLCNTFRVYLSSRLSDIYLQLARSVVSTVVGISGGSGKVHRRWINVTLWHTVCGKSVN